MTERPDCIALLIDADNSPSSKIDVILAELAKIGVTNVRRAYGNWKKDGLKGWEAVLHEYAIRPIQQFDYSKGKNATDMGMVIDAMDLLYTDQPDAFGIVSSDSDFTPLVMHLKAKGAQVFGFGAKKTPMPFVNACTRFLYLENLGRSIEVEEVERAAANKAEKRETATSPARKASRRSRGSGKSRAATIDVDLTNGDTLNDIADVTAGQESSGSKCQAAGSGNEGAPLRLDSVALRRDARLVALLRNAVESAAAEDGWSALGAVGQQIGNQASFDPRNYGYRKLIDLFEASTLFEIDRRGSQVVLRDKRIGKISGR